MTQSAIQRVSVEQARGFLARSNALILDVRDAAAFGQGRIGLAIRVGNDNVMPLVGRTSKSTPILIYCYHGKSSLEYARMFVDFGFTDVSSLDGGYEAWRRAETSASQPVPGAILGEGTQDWLAAQGFPAGDCNAQAADGMTALMIAARLGLAGMVADLLRAGAHVETRNADGNTALWMACVGGAIEVVDLLLASGSNLDNQNDNGATCLMYAASKGNATLTARLIAAGAEESLETLDGYNAFDMAATRECLKLLRRSHSGSIPARH